ncbi:hypothetical protein MPDQ_000656 [Monascus purpureus]|uniref:Uncharacterized protein n=1 Tax=Monascus purpureus TaxID=5098 RepID=A0A507QSY2_MONPU|nr:hypothetical protein MPDQ_000656 [Monascus purpureus]
MSLGPSHAADFNVVYELTFSDNVVWMARIPLAHAYFQPETSASCAATLKNLKKHRSISVPEVLDTNANQTPRMRSMRHMS